MSENPETEGRWAASSGQAYAPELHPSARDAEVEGIAPPAPSGSGMAIPAVPEAGTDTQVLTTLRPQPVPELVTEDGSEATVPHLSRWNGNGDRSAAVGPQFPDLFQKAVEGSHLADNVSVRFADGSELGNPVDESSGRRETRRSAVAVGVVGGGIGVGEFTGASARRRWRRGR